MTDKHTELSEEEAKLLFEENFEIFQDIPFSRIFTEGLVCHEVVSGETTILRFLYDSNRGIYGGCKTVYGGGE
jgi:hypothetical protein